MTQEDVNRVLMKRKNKHYKPKEIANILRCSLELVNRALENMRQFREVHYYPDKDKHRLGKPGFKYRFKRLEE